MKEKVIKKKASARSSVILAPKNFQIARAKLDYTCTDVANMINVSKQYFSSIESGKVGISKDRAKEIAKAMKAKLVEIFEIDEKNRYYSK